MTLSGDPTTLAQHAASLAGLLDRVDPSAAAELHAIAASLADPTFRLVVFGEFNQGKSTLINALLGADALPMSLLPSTALLTEIGYGDAPSATVRVDGEERPLGSLSELADFATLDLHRQARAGVQAVRVAYPSPLCRPDVRIFDTPGLNDRAEQDEAAAAALELADLVLFVVDIRRLGTLNERTVLDQWLRGRGLDAVIVAANFVNLVPPEEYADLRARLAAFAERWGCPYLPENSFEVDALGGLRARLAGDEPACHRSGMGRLAEALERAVTENRQLLLRRSRMGRLRAWLRAHQPALAERRSVAETRAAREAQRAESLAAAGERGLREVSAECQALRAAWGAERTVVLAAVQLATRQPPDRFPDLEAECAAKVAAFMEPAQPQLAAALRRAAAELHTGPPLAVRVQTEWAFRLPSPTFEVAPDPLGTLPRDREQAAAAAKELADRGRRVAGRAAAGLPRGVGGLLDRAGQKADTSSTPGRLLDQARGAWSTLKVPAPPDPDPHPPQPEATPASREAIERAAARRLDDVDAYLARLEEKLLHALRRRIEQAAPAERHTQAREELDRLVELDRQVAGLLDRPA